IVLGKLVSFSVWVWVALAVLALLLAILARVFANRLPPSPYPLPTLIPFTFLLLLGLFSGAARYQMSVPKFDAFHIAFYNDRDYDLLITGTLVEPPDYRDNYTNLRVEVSSVNTGDTDLPVNGLILVRVSDNLVFHYGDI